MLDPSFGADELAQALGIHSSKNIIRRHLTSELLSVLVPARYVCVLTVKDQYPTKFISHPDYFSW